ncbi:hypothetical protein Plhal304r1_c044g0125061 [Plasmopara halstedii]
MLKEGRRSYLEPESRDLTTICSVDLTRRGSFDSQRLRSKGSEVNSKIGINKDDKSFKRRSPCCMWIASRTSENKCRFSSRDSKLLKVALILHLNPLAPGSSAQTQPLCVCQRGL